VVAAAEEEEDEKEEDEDEDAAAIVALSVMAAYMAADTCRFGLVVFCSSLALRVGDRSVKQANRNKAQTHRIK
jgi:hypothetical protein